MPPSPREQKPNFKPAPGKKYIALYKSFDVLSQFTQELPGQRTLAEFNLPANVYPVGRLDRDSEGLLILSDDKRITGQLLDPDHAHERVYLAQVENIPSDESLKNLERGVVIQGRKTLPCRTARVAHELRLPPGAPVRFRKNIPTSWILITLCEGKNRQVRKMTAASGYPTLRLLRVAIGRLFLFDLGLEPGEWRELNGPEVAMLFATPDQNEVLNALTSVS